MHRRLRTTPARRTSSTSEVRVLHAAPYLWSGAGQVITRLAESQRDAHVVGIVTSPPAGELRNWPAYERRLACAGVRRWSVDLFHRGEESFWIAVAKMREVIDEFEPDIVHTHAGTPTAVALLARGMRSDRVLPLIAHFYSWGLGRAAWMNHMDLWAFAHSDLTVCSARAYRKLLMDGGVAPRRLRLVPWGLPEGLPDASARAPSTRLSHAQKPIIGTLGRIERRKGQLALVRAFARLLPRWPHARLEIAGPVAEDAYANEIQATVDRLGISGSVRMTGQVPDPSRFLSRWSVYVSLSVDEGQGLAVLEAMSHRVPIVARRASGIEDYLSDGRTGLTVAKNGPREVAGLIDRLLTDPRLATRLSTAAFAMVSRRYSWTRTTAQIEKMYLQLMSR